VHTVDNFVDDGSLLLFCWRFGILSKAVINHLSEAFVSNMVEAFLLTPPAKNIVVSEDIVGRERIHGGQSVNNRLQVIDTHVNTRGSFL
jgi:hypothetical protein